MKMPKGKGVASYIATHPPIVQKMLKQIRAAILKSAPGAEEHIAYGMPGYKLHGALVYFAGYQKYLGFYPTPSAIRAFRKMLSPYKTSKGTVQFPLDKPLPMRLVIAMVKFRAKENLARFRTRRMAA